MGRVRGHWRSAHRRNGKWVRRAWVREHSRRGGRRPVSTSKKALKVTRETRRERDNKHRISAAKAANRVGTTGWQSRVLRHARNAAGDQLWRQWPTPCSLSNCVALARTARSLLRTRRLLHALVGKAAGKVLSWVREPSFEVTLARTLVQHFPQPSDVYFEKAARCLQALGILCCLASSRDMAQCPCLQDLAKDQAIGHLETQLRLLANKDAWPEIRNDVTNSQSILP